jgi:hypothetical protein
VEEDAYTTGQAARFLKVTDRGELEAHHDEPGGHYAALGKRSGVVAGHPLR